MIKDRPPIGVVEAPKRVRNGHTSWKRGHDTRASLRGHSCLTCQMGPWTKHWQHGLTRHGQFAERDNQFFQCSAYDVASNTGE
jgi:hypothetical protein